jgi:hypothetical protein
MRLFFNLAVRTIVLVSACVLASTPLHGQSKEDANAERLRLSKSELSQYRALTALVDGVIAGKEQAPADLNLAFYPHFIRSSTNIFVPYMLELSGAKLSSFPVALYIRAVRKSEASEPAGQTPFTDIYFIPNAGALISSTSGVLLARALELPPGEFDLYFALAETPPRNQKTPPKRVVYTTPVSVPDLSKDLTTSSLILAKSLEEGTAQLTPRQQMEQPFNIGGQRITPTFSPVFSKSGELLFVFLIYNEGSTSAGKPDLDVAYTMFRGTEPKPFAKMPTTSFNATTLPAEFSLAAGHQVLVVQGVPLGSFAPGDYRLGITITDKTTAASINREIKFTVTN